MKIARAVLDEVIGHARAEAPIECCGLLIGTSGTIDECVRTHNVRASATEYLIDPREHFATIRRLRGTLRAVLGAYHSHPASPAVPSPTDIRESYYPDFVWLIVSLALPKPPQIRAYRIVDGKVAPVEIDLVE